MAYIYRTQYVNDFTKNPLVKEVHFFQEKIKESKKKNGPMRNDPFSIKGMVENSKPFDFEGHLLKECWEVAADEFTELLEQLPEVIDDEIIKRRLENTYKYAKRKEVNPNNCFQYSKSVSSSQSDISDIDRILIQIRAPFDKSYVPVTIVAEGSIIAGPRHFFIASQSRVDAIYNRSEQELILGDSNQINYIPEIEQYRCYHYLPESMGLVKKLEFK